MTEIYDFNCKSCSYASRHPLGSPETNQILTDINTEFSDFRLFICSEEKKLVHIDVQDKSFAGKCPSDNSQLLLVENLRDIRCPRCKQTLTVEISRPISDGGKQKK